MHQGNVNARGPAGREREDYLQQYSVAGYWEKFLSDIASGTYAEHVSTGFEKLDHALNGGLYNRFYVIGGACSMGKRMFLTQMADQIAAMGRDVLVFSLTEPKFDIMSRSISRLTMLEALKNGRLREDALGVTDIMDGIDGWQEDGGLFERAMDAYSQFANNIYVILKDQTGPVGERVALKHYPKFAYFEED